MAVETGILLAFVAMISWALGDFLIQRSTRKFGNWEPLLIITGFGAIVLAPFVYNDLAAIISSDFNFLVFMSVGALMFLAALIDFEALRKGKICVIEPIMALEVPVAAAFAFLVINESLSIIESLLVIFLISGLVLVSLRSRHLSSKIWFERGVLLAVGAAVLMGVSNFMVGFASRSTNPMLAIWFVDLFIAVSCIFYLVVNKKGGSMLLHIRQNKRLLLGVSIIDNIAWVSFAAAATLVPVTIATAISEGYIAIAALLGIIFNKELMLRHQKVGIALSIISAIALAYIYA